MNYIRGRQKRYKEKERWSHGGEGKEGRKDQFFS
jgi:hypothetical protein